MTSVLVTGGAGFFAALLAGHLRERGCAVTLLDRLADERMQREYPFVRADLTRPHEIAEAFARYGPFERVFHCAALMGHEFPDPAEVWRHNVEGTRTLGEVCVQAGVRKIVYTSSICVYGRGYEHTVTEEEPTCPVEMYGRSKLEGERILFGLADRIDVAALRCPTIVAPGRLGLLAILFEFVREGRRIYLVGDGSNRYQFVYAGDLAEACRLSGEAAGSGLYNVGADEVLPLREVYRSVIDHAGSGSRIVRLPRRTATAALKLLHRLGVSPLGPYHYRMISESFIFETAKIKRELGWRPTKTGQQVLCEAYDYYVENRERVEAAREEEVSAHKRGSKMGIIRLVKWLS